MYKHIYPNHKISIGHRAYIPEGGIAYAFSKPKVCLTSVRIGILNFSFAMRMR